MTEPAPVEPLRLGRVPLLAAALCFALGDALAWRWHPPALLLAGVVNAFLLALLALGWSPRVGWAATLTVWVAVGCTCAQLQPPLDRQTHLQSFADGLSRTVRGRVERIRMLADTPDPDAPAKARPAWAIEPGGWEIDDGAPRRSVDLKVDAIEALTPDRSQLEPVTGGMRLTLLQHDASRPPLALGCGDEVELPVRLRVPDVYRDPGAWSQADFLLGQGIGVTGSARAEDARVIGAAAGSWSCRLAGVQAWGATRWRHLAAASAGAAWLPANLRLTPDDAGILAAMLFGDRGGLRRSVRVGFEQTGMFHLLVVSGLHVALLAGTLFWALRKLRLPEGPAVLLTIALTAAYALLTGWGAPVQRALLMASAYLVGRWLGRETTALNSLGLATLAILALNPRALHEAGFQMTVLVILAVAGLALPAIARTWGPWHAALDELDMVNLDVGLRPALAQFRVRLRGMTALLLDLVGERPSGSAWLGRRLVRLPIVLLRLSFGAADALAVGVAIELCMSLPMAVYFHRATPLALPVNFLSIPLVAVLVGSAVLTFAVGVLSVTAAALPGAMTAMLLHGVRAVVTRASHAAVADLRIPAPPAAAAALALAAMAIACIALRSRRRGVWLGVAAVALVPLAVLWPARASLRPGVLELTALDVGQGDSLLVVSPTGATMLVDAGGPVGRTGSITNASGASDRWDVGEEVVAPYLWSRHLRRLDVVMLSHAHSDHMGGMPAVLRDLRPRELWLGAEPGHSPGLAALLAEARTLGIQVRRFRAGDTLAWGGVHAEVLSPQPTYENAGDAKNDDSLVVRLGFGAGGVLLEGDAEVPSEQAMLAHGLVHPTTLLKVGHHGSHTSTTQAFLDAVAPREAVISVGRGNTFGHPRWDVLDRLEAAHVQTWRTDREGLTTFLLHKDGSISESAAALDPAARTAPWGFGASP